MRVLSGRDGVDNPVGGVDIEGLFDSTPLFRVEKLSAGLLPSPFTPIADNDPRRIAMKSLDSGEGKRREYWEVFIR